MPDFLFNGTPNTFNNAVSFEVAGIPTDDGTCTGTPALPGTIVQAANAATAITVCGDLGVPGLTDPARLADYGYAAPADAWTCIDNP